MVKSLATRAFVRLQAAFRPSTLKAYTSMFRTFMCFCVFVDLDVCHLDVHGILAYLECLHFNKVSVNMISNHLAAIKAKLIVLGLNPSPLDHKKVKYYIRALKLNRPITVTSHNIITVRMLLKIVYQCDYIYIWVKYSRLCFYLHFSDFLGCLTSPHILSPHLISLDI